MLVPLSYNLRSLWVRRSATFLTVVGIGATVAVLAGVLSLENGFRTMFTSTGREDVAVFLRPGATNEGDSIFARGRGVTLINTLPEIDTGEFDAPLASMECYLAIRRDRLGGGETNVPIRGVQPMTFEVFDGSIEIVDGRNFAAGSDEVIVGSKLAGRIENCQLGDVLQINVTPFRVVGIFDSEGSFASEIWGDMDRMLSALERDSPNRVVARLKPDVDIDDLNRRLADHRETPAKVQTEREYLTSQTAALSTVLLILGGFLAVIMGVAAVFTATNTMLAAISARTHEVGILLATGFRPFPIFFCFLLEALLLGLLGGLIGCLLALPLNGIETGTTNFNTFTEVGFAFRVSPQVLLQAVSFALLLGLLGGALPAWRAARMTPTDALRRQ